MLTFTDYDLKKKKIQMFWKRIEDQKLGSENMLAAFYVLLLHYFWQNN